MYREFYGLQRAPFEMAPDPAFLVLGLGLSGGSLGAIRLIQALLGALTVPLMHGLLSRRYSPRTVRIGVVLAAIDPIAVGQSPFLHREGLATLVYGVQSRKGFVLLTGEVGTGKTTLLHSLLGQLDSTTASAFIFNPRLEPLDFFHMLFEDFGIEKACRTKAEYLLALNDFLIERLEKNETALLIVDEAQTLSMEMLEEVRLLSNLETPSSKLLQIMLVGQPELNDLLAQPELRQLRQRIVLRHHLRPFDEKELDLYITERLRVAGNTGEEIFTSSARRKLFAVTQGIPRLVNIVCDGALLAGYAQEQRRISGKMILEVARDLELVLGSENRGASSGSANGRGRDTMGRRRRWFSLFRRTGAERVDG